jgi:hypothetical protein
MLPITTVTASSVHSRESTNLTVYKKKSGTKTYSVNTIDKALENQTNAQLFKKFAFFYRLYHSLSWRFNSSGLLAAHQLICSWLLVTVCGWTWHNITEGLSIHQWCCENLKYCIHCHVSKNLPQNHIMSQMIQVNFLTHYFLKIKFYIVFPSMRKSL